MTDVPTADRIRPRLLLLLALLAIGMALRLAFGFISVTHLQPSSDESILMLQAEEIRAGARPLLFMAQPYIFPLESYLIAPFVKVLPASALGARLPPFLLHLAALAAGLWLLRRVARGPAWLAGAALMLVPSAYLLMVQSAYRPPAYSALLLLFPVCLGLADQARRSAQPALWLMATGCCCGLAFSSHMLALPYVAAGLLLAVAVPDRRQLVPRLALVAVSFGVGLAPYLLAMLRMPGAHEAVAIPITFREVLARLWQPTLEHTFVGALGLRVPFFVDEPAAAPLAPGLDTAGSILVLLLLAGVTVARAVTHARSWRATRRIDLQVVDALLLVILLNLLLFAGNKRADSRSYRYLLLSVAGLPYVLAWAAGQHRWAARPAVLAVLVLVAVNGLESRRLMSRWRQPDFARAAGVPDLQPALRYLREHGLTNAISTYGTAYRVTYQSDGRVTGAQIYNERFPSWPVPYKEEVDRDPGAAYVLSSRFRNLTPDGFGRHLAATRLEGFQVHTAADFVVFHAFPSRADPYRLLSRQLLRADTEPASPASRLIVDGSLATFWTTDGLQKGGESLTLTWSNAAPLAALRLLPGLNHGDLPRRVEVAMRHEGAWRPLLTNTPAVLEELDVTGGQPRFGRAHCTLQLGGAVGDGLRVTSVEPRTNRNWSVAEAEVLVQETAGEGAAGPLSSPAGIPNP
jgi:4-amino-4-deoxy-L-arabinose transferase-like glycosyltransferase